jgi:hypothetical protein
MVDQIKKQSNPVTLKTFFPVKKKIELTILKKDSDILYYKVEK